MRLHSLIILSNVSLMQPEGAVGFLVPPLCMDLVYSDHMNALHTCQVNLLAAVMTSTDETTVPRTTFIPFLFNLFFLETGQASRCLHSDPPFQNYR